MPKQTQKQNKKEIELKKIICKNCYGKGYSTELIQVRIAPDFIGDKEKKFPPEIKMNFCKCERGKQLKDLIIAEREKWQEHERKGLLFQKKLFKKEREEMRKKIKGKYITEMYRETFSGREFMNDWNENIDEILELLKE